MIKLKIDGKTTALPADFSFPMVIENPYFTDAAEYTGEVVLTPKAIDNINIFGPVGRFEKTKRQQVKDCELSDDNRILIKGSATTIEYTPDALSVQILGGNSAVNYCIRWQEMYINELDLGKLHPDWQSIFPTSTDNRNLEPFARRIMGEPSSQEWVMLPCKNEAGLEMNNIERWFPDRTNTRLEYGWPYAQYTNPYEWALQPRICAIVRRIINALGYSVTVFDAEQTNLKYLYYVNVKHTLYLAEMLPRWSVSKFLDEVQTLLGCVFVFDNINMTCSIKSRNNFFSSEIVHLEQVDDAFSVSIDESAKTDVSNMNVKYNVEDYPLVRLFDETATEKSDFRYFATKEEADAALRSGSYNVVAVVGGHQYINRTKEEGAGISFAIEEVNDLGPNYDAEVQNQKELNFVPAKMDKTLAWSTQLEGAGNPHRVGWHPTPSPCGMAPKFQEDYFNIDEYLNGKTDFDGGKENEEMPMCIAFFTSWDKLPEIDMLVNNPSGEWDGTYTTYCKTKLWCGWVYMTDDVSYDKMQQSSVVYTNHMRFDPCCSLRNIEDYDTIWSLGVGSASVIDTTAPLQITFFDDIDGVDINKTYIIRGHRYLCAKIELTITNEGIKKAKKGTFYQIG